MPATVTKTALPITKRAPALRLRPALRQALSLIAMNGLSHKAASAAAGLHPVTLSKALAKPHVREYLDNLQAQAALEALNLKKVAKGAAIREGIRLMHEASSESVRARMVEFFAAEPAGAPMVQVNVGQARGYEYLPPALANTPVYAPITDATSGTPAQIIEHDQGDSGDGVA